ncbi:MAG: polysaccharide export protein [Nitrospirae bacterium]|uniref:polysaccharide biosynthesis/export family protein n=1 Tax=Candidatus Magnetobacterium casense TaxID=1455061 RepID=UPI00058DA19A|nr:polysaccharide biosynthesis/export family protein [Candidatus Magnetobacterium casensis]MBF0338286.1 polysaccharide export protein [Nitrospirota bacterium]
MAKVFSGRWLRNISDVLHVCFSRDSVNRLTAILLLFVFGCASVQSDVAPQGQLAELTSNSQQDDNNEEISRLGPGDIIAINVYRHTDLSMNSITLRPDGGFSFPLVGQVYAKGLSTKELEAKMKEMLAQYIVKPDVVINAQKFNSHKIYVLGEVARPGVVPIEDDLTLIKAIALSGGITHDARESGVVLLRRGKIYTLNFANVLTGVYADNVRLRNGDILYVPSSGLADTTRFLSNISSILGFIIGIESGIILTPQVGDALRGKSGNTSPIAIPSK